MDMDFKDEEDAPTTEQTEVSAAGSGFSAGTPPASGFAAVTPSSPTMGEVSAAAPVFTALGPPASGFSAASPAVSGFAADTPPAAAFAEESAAASGFTEAAGAGASWAEDTEAEIDWWDTCRMQVIWGDITGDISDQSDLWGYLQGTSGILSGGAVTHYFRGDLTWQTLTQNAVAGLTTSSSPSFQGLFLTAQGIEVPADYGIDAASGGLVLRGAPIYARVTGNVAAQVIIRQSLSSTNNIDLSAKDAPAANLRITASGMAFTINAASGNLALASANNVTIAAATAAAKALLLGGDANLYRSAADTLYTDDAFGSAVSVTAPQLTATTKVTTPLIDSAAGDLTLDPVANLVLTLPDAAGANKLSILDSAASEMAVINSDGQGTLRQVDITDGTAVRGSFHISTTVPETSAGGVIMLRSSHAAQNKVNFWCRPNIGGADQLGITGDIGAGGNRSVLIVVKPVGSPTAGSAFTCFTGASGYWANWATWGTECCIAPNTGINFIRFRNTHDYTNAGTNVCFVQQLSTGMAAIGRSTTLAAVGQFDVQIALNTRKGMIVKGAASQSANLQDWQDSSANVLAAIDSAGSLVFLADTNLYRSAANTLKTDDSLTIGANLDHDGSSIGFFGTAPAAQSTAWSVTAGYTADKAFDPETAVLLEVARVVGTLVDALKSYGILGA